ncbi:hypothetical protein NFI96_027432, partial [Prochilodus magdalenae]
TSFLKYFRNGLQLILLSSFLTDVTTCCKLCEICGHFYRYQEWTEGLHNFNDHLILTLHLCLFLRNSVQNHTAVGRALEALEQTNQKKYPSHDSLLHGYLHFEALTAHDYNFSCVNCGDHPPVVILDLHKKGVFSMPGEQEFHFMCKIVYKNVFYFYLSCLSVSDVKDPPPEFDGHVDIEEFWQSVAQEIVCRGFVKSNRENLFAITPAYDKWAPWIGPRTRASKTVINTEYAKMNAKKSSVEQAELK